LSVLLRHGEGDSMINSPRFGIEKNLKIISSSFPVAVFGDQ